MSHGENAVSMDLLDRRRMGGTGPRVLVSLLALLVLGPFASLAAAQSQAEIRVKVVGLQSDQGELRWALYNKKDTFATKDGPITKGARPIKNGQVEFVIPNVPFGTSGRSFQRHSHQEPGALSASSTMVRLRALAP